jgi:hypothetical protein
MKRKVEQQITDTDRDYRTGLPSLLYVTSGSSPGFGLYFSVSMPAGKNNANGKFHTNLYQLELSLTP